MARQSMLCFAVPGKMARVVIPPANYWTMVRRLIMLLTGLQEKSFREAIKLFLLEQLTLLGRISHQ